LDHRKYQNIIFDYMKWALRPEDAVKVVVLGHQKSGTTVIGALLGRVSGFGVSNDPLFMIDQGTGQIAELLLHEPERINRYCRRRRDLFSQKIIKDPDFIFIYPSLKECYKNASFLFVVRDPRDMIRSICNRLGLKGTFKKPIPALSDMKGGNRHWELILSGSLPCIENIGINESNFIMNLAHRWNFASEIYLNNAHEMILIKYEEFLKNKEVVIKKIAEEAGLPLGFPITKYLDVQYQPKGKHNVDWLEFFGVENLFGIEQICSQYMRSFGYEKLSQ
jgi:hypothetical protein